MREEDASDLEDDGDFERDDDEGVDGDGYMEELDVLVINVARSRRGEAN